MNKRARNRLIGVTAIILLVAAVLMVTVLPSGGSRGSEVKDIATGGNETLVGTRVKVSGTVIAGSWDKKSNPMVFTIRSEGATSGPEVRVTFDGPAPNTFGSDTVAILTGTVDKLGSLEANEMVTKCPSKYETSTDKATITAVLSTPSDSPIRVQGFLKPGSMGDAAAAQRFVLATNTDGSGDSFPVAFTGSMPAGAADGVQLVVFGKLEAGVFVATEVSIAQN